MPWLEPSISLRWGPYTRLDGDEQKMVVDMTVAAKTAGLITTRMAIEKFADAGVFDVDSIDAVLDALEEERDADDERAIKVAQGQGAVATSETGAKAGSPNQQKQGSE